MDPRRVLSEQGVNDQTIEKFLNYHSDRKEIWDMFEKFSLDAARAGKPIGAKAIMERVRWFTEIEQNGSFKVCNSYTAYYARMFAAKHPGYSGLFEFRPVKGLKNTTEGEGQRSPEGI